MRTIAGSTRQLLLLNSDYHIRYDSSQSACGNARREDIPNCLRKLHKHIGQSDESLPLDNLPIQEEPAFSGPGLYFGSLHAHSSISDGAASIEDIFSTASQIPGLDFLAVTDHSDSFDTHLEGSIGSDGTTVSTGWASGKAAAAAVTSASFVGIYGYEMSWPANMQIGHISTFCTPGFQSWQQEAYNKYNGALKNYYDALSSVPESISQFNHPGTQYGTFLDFEYSEAADRAVALL